MKKNQKGFIINLLLVSITLLIVSGGLYLYITPVKNIFKIKVTKNTLEDNIITPEMTAIKEGEEDSKIQTGNNSLKSKYCLDDNCWNDNSLDLFQELFGEKLNAISSDNLNIYTSPTVSGFYFDTEWITTCKSLKQKVYDLISGKFTDREKILAIANWVSNSRQYGVLPEGEVNGICELFNANAGVCADAASLTTAMLRFAKIPARVVDPKTYTMNAHQYTQVFFDGKWFAIDTTFGGGERNIFEPTSILSDLTYYAFDKPKEIIIPSFNNPYNIEFTYYLADGIFVITSIKNNLITENDAIREELYGTITYIKPRYSSKDMGFINNTVLIAKNLQCDYYECRKMSGKETKILMPQEYLMINAKKMIRVFDGKVSQQIDNQFVVNADLRSEYYVINTYPAGQYRFIYEDSSSGKMVAYYDFELTKSGSVIISPDKLIKATTISDDEFNSFINYLKAVK